MLLGQLPSTTGHYFLSPGFRDVAITRDSETMFQTFRRHGYYTATRGKIFHGRADPASFDEISPATGWRRPQEKLHYKVPGSHPLWDWGQVDVPDADMRDAQTAAWAADRLPQLAAADQPFFLAVGFSLPHVPIYASQTWFERYPLDTLQLPATLSTDGDDIPEIALQLSLNPTAPRDTWMQEHDESKQAVRAYLATISFVDALVGTVLEGLAQSGEADETIVVLWSDHGFHMGEKQKWAKRSLWEESTRVPLIVRAPGKAAGETAAPVGLIDIYPTLVELCGLPMPEHLDGRSLNSLLEDPQAAWEHPALCTFGKNNHSLRSRHFRYTLYADGSEELYDHRSDPHEWSNLAKDAKFARVIAEHRRFLPQVNAVAVPNSRGSDSPLYGESQGLHKRNSR